MLDLRYVYEWQKDRFEYFWNLPLPLKENCAAMYQKDAYLLPLKPGRPGLGKGGITNKNSEPLEMSWMHWGRPVAMGGAYQFDKSKAAALPDETYLYLGYIHNHYGHMLTDCSTRLYALKKFPGVKPVALLSLQAQIDTYFSSIRRLLELAGLNLADVVFINEPTFVKSIIIPEESYRYGLYYSNEYIDTFQTISNNITPSRDYNYRKVYFSRTCFNFPIGIKEIGNEMLDELFKKLGFMIIYPDDYSVDDQISILRNAEEYACVQGTLVHNLQYLCDKDTKIYIINRSYEMLIQFFDSCKISGKTPIFLDFYAAKRPSLFFYGPFLFYQNDLMNKFMRDNNLEMVNNPQFSAEKQLGNYNRYEYEFLRQGYHFNRHFSLPKERSAGNYFDNNFLTQWLNELFPVIAKSNRLLDYGPADAVAAKISDLEKMLQWVTSLTNIFVAYDIHLSDLGWQPRVLAGYQAGLPYSSHYIEAIRIFAPAGLRIALQVFYVAEGWSAAAHAGEVAGTTGKRKRINGLKIWTEGQCNMQPAYRVFTDRWEEWQPAGAEVLSDTGFKALEFKLVEETKATTKQQS